MDIIKKYSRTIYKVTAVIAIIFFFIPTSLVSCGSDEQNVSAAHMVIGYKGGGFDGEEWILTPQIWVLALIILPLVILILSVIAYQKEKPGDCIKVFSLLEIVFWIGIVFSLEYAKKEWDGFMKYRLFGSYYLAIFNSLITFIVAVLETSFEKDTPPKTGQFTLSNLFPTSNIQNETERIWMCKNCFKVFAYQLDFEEPDCPYCHEKLLLMGTSMEHWKKMGDSDRLTHMRHIAENNSIREL